VSNVSVLRKSSYEETMPGGRPRKANNRGRVISIRLTQQEFAALERAALASQVSVSEYMRRESLGSIEIDAYPRTETDGTDRRIDLSDGPSPPTPTMEVLQAASAKRFAECSGPFGSRLQFWVAGQAEVMMVYRQDGGLEAWRLFREGTISLSALLDALRAYLAVGQSNESRKAP
jgi:hypothetical protein